MTTTTKNGNVRAVRIEAIDKLGAIEYHVAGLRELVQQLPDPVLRERPEEGLEVFADAELRAFARWTFEMLGLGEVDDVSDQVREARRVLVMALSRGADLGVAREQRLSGISDSEREFVDMFAGEGYEDPEELDIDPIAVED